MLINCIVYARLASSYSKPHTSLRAKSPSVYHSLHERVRLNVYHEPKSQKNKIASTVGGGRERKGSLKVLNCGTCLQLLTLGWFSLPARHKPIVSPSSIQHLCPANWERSRFEEQLCKSLRIQTVTKLQAQADFCLENDC